MGITKRVDYEKYFDHRNIVPSPSVKYVLQSYLREVLPKDKDSRILDIGCGLGLTLFTLREMKYKNIKGIDVSANSVHYCKNNGLNVEKISNITSFCRRCKQEYDFIIMSHVLEHIEKSEIINTLREIKNKLLSKNGCLCIMVPNAQSNTDCYWAYEDFTHNVLFTAGSLYYVLKSANFKSIVFLDELGLEGSTGIRRVIKKLLLSIYKLNKKLWNKVTSSSYHINSPEIFTYELKVIAKK